MSAPPTFTTTTSSPPLALVTGALGGIGYATASLLAKNGYSLALHYNTASSESVESLLSEIKLAHKPFAGRTAKAFKADLSSLEETRSLYKDVVGQLGDPEVLFLNAGTTGGVSGPGSLADVSIDVFEATWRVNTASPILLTQLCLPAMEKAGIGRIVFNSSVAALTGGAVGPHYASSKSALHGFVHWLASRLAGKGVTVNAIAPALVEGTKMLPKGDQAEALKSRIPLGRLGLPEEMAETVLWMVKTGYLTNKIITIDGGMVPR